MASPAMEVEEQRRASCGAAARSGVQCGGRAARPRGAMCGGAARSGSVAGEEGEARSPEREAARTSPCCRTARALARRRCGARRKGTPEREREQGRGCDTEEARRLGEKRTGERKREKH